MEKRKQLCEINPLAADNLEPYRRLIEVQKQLVLMAKKHEQARRECDALRDQIAHEVTRSRHWQGRWRKRLRLSTAWLFKRFAIGASSETAFPALTTGNPSHAESN